MIFLYRNTICSQGRKRNPNDWSYDMSYKSTMTLPNLTNSDEYFNILYNLLHN